MIEYVGFIISFTLYNVTTHTVKLHAENAHFTHTWITERIEEAIQKKSISHSTTTAYIPLLLSWWLLHHHHYCMDSRWRIFQPDREATAKIFFKKTFLCSLLFWPSWRTDEDDADCNDNDDDEDEGDMHGILL